MQSCKMDAMFWPSQSELDAMREKVAKMSGGDAKEVRFVVSPYRICPLGAHIDHQGGTVSAMTINKGILLGFVSSDDSQVVLSSGQFKGEVKFRVDEIQLPKFSSGSNNSIQVKNSSKSKEECNWGSYARGALYALQKRGNCLRKPTIFGGNSGESVSSTTTDCDFQEKMSANKRKAVPYVPLYHWNLGIIGFICGSDGLDSSGLSSSAAVGIAYLMAFEKANDLTVSPTENIEYDRLIENEYLGLRNGILDQSAILLSSYDCLTCMNCKTKEHKLIHPPNWLNGQKIKIKNAYKILVALSGLKQALTTNPGYNRRVAECQEAARILLQ